MLSEKMQIDCGIPEWTKHELYLSESDFLSIMVIGTDLFSD